MRFRPTKCRVILGVIVACCFMDVPSAKSCGDFRKPETHFEGVNEYGFVSYWDQIGELSLGDGYKIPLIIGFRSDWESLAPSPYLGSGWQLPFLDSHFVQRSDNSFDMLALDGYTVPFGRDSKNPNILHGARDWKAELKGDQISVWAPCGWKLLFTKGRISAITTPTNKVIEIVRDQSGKADAVVAGTKILLKVKNDARNNVIGLVVGENQIDIQPTEKPIISRLGNQNLLSGKGTAVGSIVLPSGATKTFDYTPDSKIQPTLAITKSSQKTRVLTWNPSDRYIISDNDWQYRIAPPLQPGYNVGIERVNANNQKESWFYDQAKGEEITVSLDGTKKTRSWFLSGMANGRIRQEIVEPLKGDRIQKKYSYDQTGELLRTYLNDNIQSQWQVVREDNGAQLRIEKDAKNSLISVTKYDSFGRIRNIYTQRTRTGLAYDDDPIKGTVVRRYYSKKAPQDLQEIADKQKITLQ